MDRCIVDFRDENDAQRTGYLFEQTTDVVKVEMADGEIRDVSESKIIRMTGGENDKN